jgi:hypothetical protein
VKWRSCGGPSADNTTYVTCGRCAQRLLELGLVVDVARQRVFDPVGERLDDRGLGRGESVLEEERAERRLEERREDVSVPREPVELLRWRVGGVLREPRTQVELARNDGAARPRDDVRADLRQPSLGEVGEPRVDLVRDRELENAVAEELEPLV